MKRSYTYAFSLDPPDLLSSPEEGAQKPATTHFTQNPSAVVPLRDLSAYSKLCSVCEKINFGEIYSASAENVKHHGTAVTEHRKDLDPECAFCAFVRSIALPASGALADGNLERDGYHLRMFDALKMLRLRRRAGRVHSGPNIVLAVVLGPAFGPDRGYEGLLRKLNLGISKGVITLHPTSSESLLPGPFDYFARPVKPQLDFKLPRSWIRECQASKSGFLEECNVKAPRLPNIYVIDCHSRNTVPLREGQEFLALSYVWGSKHKPIARVSGMVRVQRKIPRKAPKTIEDAIEVVKMLRKQYLWVDRY